MHESTPDWCRFSLTKNIVVWQRTTSLYRMFISYVAEMWDVVRVMAKGSNHKARGDWYIDKFLLYKSCCECAWVRRHKLETVLNCVCCYSNRLNNAFPVLSINLRCGVNAMVIERFFLYAPTGRWQGWVDKSLLEIWLNNSSNIYTVPQLTVDMNTKLQLWQLSFNYTQSVIKLQDRNVLSADERYLRYSRTERYTAPWTNT